MATPPAGTPAKEGQAELTEAEIAVHWKEEESFLPQPKFIGQANLTDPAVNERFSLEHFPECFREFGDMLTWDKDLDPDARLEQRPVLPVVDPAGSSTLPTTASTGTSSRTVTRRRSSSWANPKAKTASPSPTTTSTPA